MTPEEEKAREIACGEHNCSKTAGPHHFHDCNALTDRITAALTEAADNAREEGRREAFRRAIEAAEEFTCTPGEETCRFIPAAIRAASEEKP